MAAATDSDAAERRSGSYALALLAVPLNGALLTELFDGPMRLADLRRSSGAAPQSTVRARLKALEAGEMMARQAREGSLGVVDFALTQAGVDLLLVLAALERWLQLAPEGPLAFGTAAATAAIKALEGGWSSTMLAALSGGPLSLGDLSRDIERVSFPSLARRLTAMRRSRQVQACPRDGHDTRYEVTEWLQQSVAPLAAAVRWEQIHFADDTRPMARLDVEAAFLLALPLLRMESTLGGSCRLEVEIKDEESLICGAVATVERGRVVSSVGGARGVADSWASGSPLEWARTMSGDGDGDGDGDDLEVGGDKLLAAGLLAGLNGALFGAEAEDPPAT